MESNTVLYDVVIVPGGGIQKDFMPNAWVCERLDHAANLYKEGKTRFILVLSRGTPHKPPPRSSEDVPVDESTCSADYLIEKYSVNPKHIFLDRWSLDTIGNAYAALTMHLIPRNLRKIHLITSDWHLPRTREIFDTVLSCGGNFDITYTGCPSKELTDEDVKVRFEHELKSLDIFKTQTKPILINMEELHKFVFEGHNCYKAGSYLKPVKNVSSKASY